MSQFMGNGAWIASVERKAEHVAAAIDRGLSEVGRLPSRGEIWAVKLNLTYPSYLPGVVNSPRFVEGLCQWSHDRCVRLIFIEGDGGNGSYSAQDAFVGTGICDIAKRYQIECISLSEGPWEWRQTKVAGRAIRLPYSPFFGRRNFDHLISTPLFKNHIFTTVSLGMKNLWGCIPDAYRMYYHHQLDYGIVALCMELQPSISIFDGLVALRGRGPMEGLPLDMNAVMVSSNIGCGELAALDIMGIPLKRVRHLQIAKNENLLPDSPVTWLTDPTLFARTDFVLDRTLVNHMSIQIGKIPFLQRLIYHSLLSPIIYAFVNRIRGESAQTKLIRDKWAGRYHPIPRKHK